jgi:hypothetical protein
VLFLGRGLSFPIALEGALKLKEISYVHAEGYAAGEMKHGPIALIDSNVPVVVMVPRDRTTSGRSRNLQEAKAREGHGHRDRERGRRGRGATRPTSHRDPEGGPPAHAVHDVLPLQLSRTTWPTSRARTSTSRATSPRPSRWSDRGQRRAVAGRSALPGRLRVPVYVASENLNGLRRGREALDDCGHGTGAVEGAPAGATHNAAASTCIAAS